MTPFTHKDILQDGQVEIINRYSSPHLSAGGTFPEPQGMPETADNSEPYIYCFSIYVYVCVCVIKCNL